MKKQKNKKIYKSPTIDSEKLQLGVFGVYGRIEVFLNTSGDTLFPA